MNTKQTLISLYYIRAHVWVLMCVAGTAVSREGATGGRAGIVGSTARHHAAAAVQQVVNRRATSGGRIQWVPSLYAGPAYTWACAAPPRWASTLRQQAIHAWPHSPASTPSTTHPPCQASHHTPLSRKEVSLL